MPTVFSGLSLLNGAALFFGIALPLLVLAYRERKKKDVHVVSSILCMRDLPKKKLSQTRIHLPPRFFVELLALLSVLLAAALPTIREEGDHKILVLDNSLSMSAVTENGQTRLDQAKKKLKEWVESSSAADFSLFITSPELTDVSKERVSASSVEDLLDGLSSFPSQDNLARAVDKIASQYSSEEIAVATDKTLKLSGNDTGRITQLTVEAPVPNAFISRAGIKENVANQKKTIWASLSLSANEKTSADLRLLGQIWSDSPSRELVLFEKKVDLNPNVSTRVEFPLPKNLSGLNVFHLELASVSNDSLPADNHAWLSITGSSSSKILIVSDDNSPRKLDTIPGIESTTLGMQEFLKLGESSLKKYDLLLYHRSSPLKLVRLPTLIVIPTAPNPIFSPADSVSSPRFSSWSEHHPIMSYLNVPSLKVPNAVTLEPQPWAIEVLNIAQGPVLLAGESDGMRLAAVGFELFPFEGRETPALSILTLNLLNWIRNSGVGAIPLVGEELANYMREPVSVTAPDGKQLDLSQTEPVIFSEHGPYLVKDKSGSASVFTANSFFRGESNTIEVHPEAVQLSAPLAESTSGGDPLWPLLAVLALILLSAEYAMRIREQRLKAA